MRRIGNRSAGAGRPPAPAAGRALSPRASALDRLADLFDRQTLSGEEKRFVEESVQASLAGHPVLSWARVPEPAFASPPRNGNCQYTFKVWALPRGQKDFVWEIPHTRRREWKAAQHGCYLELVGECDRRGHRLNRRLFWGVKVSGSRKGMGALRADVGRAGLGRLGHDSPHARPVHELLPAIGISATWYLLGFEAREADVRAYNTMDELLDDVAAGLTAAYRAFDAFVGLTGGTLVPRNPATLPQPRGGRP